jgi:hypothetical protein
VSDGRARRGWVRCEPRRIEPRTSRSPFFAKVRLDRLTPRDVLIDLGECRESCGASSASPTATARLSARSECQANRKSSSYHSTICTQSVSSTRRVGVQRGDRCLRLILAELIAARAACAMSMPSTISPVSPGCGPDRREARGFRPVGSGSRDGHGGAASSASNPCLGVVDQEGQLPGQPNRLGRRSTSPE